MKIATKKRKEKCLRAVVRRVSGGVSYHSCSSGSTHFHTRQETRKILSLSLPSRMPRRAQEGYARAPEQDLARCLLNEGAAPTRTRTRARAARVHMHMNVLRRWYIFPLCTSYVCRT